MKAPFPWMGGKSRVAGMVWQRFGDVPNYVEPFAGSLAVLLDRPHQPKTETVNDLDGLICNFWRAVKSSPDAVAHWADNPVSECDLHARHLWLLGVLPTLAHRLCADPDWHDPKIAGWWVWGLCCWIGTGWCSGDGPWRNVGGLLSKGDAGRGINRQLPHLGSAGQGINRQLPIDGIRDLMAELSARLRSVRVAQGDWLRVCGESVTWKHGLTAVFLDPPYLSHDGAGATYRTDCADVANDVREWAIVNGNNKLLRIALCGYEGEHAMPADWQCVEWKARGGYAAQGDGSNVNATRERIWFSPHCLGSKTPGLWDDLHARKS